MARDAEESGQHRSAARLYMRAVLILAGVIPDSGERLPEEPPSSQRVENEDGKSEPRR